MDRRRPGREPNTEPVAAPPSVTVFCYTGDRRFDRALAGWVVRRVAAPWVRVTRRTPQLAARIVLTVAVVLMVVSDVVDRQPSARLALALLWPAAMYVLVRATYRVERESAESPSRRSRTAVSITVGRVASVWGVAVLAVATAATAAVVAGMADPPPEFVFGSAAQAASLGLLLVVAYLATCVVTDRPDLSLADPA